MIEYIKFNNDSNINLEKRFNEYLHYTYFKDLTERNYVLSYQFYNDLLNQYIQADLYRIKRPTKTSAGFLNIQFSINNQFLPCLITKFPSESHIATVINNISDNNLSFNKINVYKAFERIFNWRLNKEQYLQDKQYQLINTNRCINFKFYQPKNIFQFDFNDDNIIINDYLSGDIYYYKIIKQQDDFFNQKDLIKLMFYIETLFAFAPYNIYFDYFREQILQLYIQVKEKYPQLQIGFVQQNFNIYALLNTQDDFELLINTGLRVYMNIKIYFTYPNHTFTLNTITCNENINFKTFSK